MHRVVTRKSYGSRAKPLLLGALALAFLAYAASALPYIASYDSPTLPNNSITNLNWTLVNITSTEDLNRSLLEWGNSTGFTNFSMSNTSMRNWNITIMNLSDSTYNYTVFLQNATGSWSQSARRLVTIDTVPPMSVVNLSNQSQGDTWINWTWTNPSDPGFNYIEVWLNGTFKANVSVNSYNTTGLLPNTSYQLQTRTVDNAGNINTTWVNATAKTLPDTTPPTITFVSPTWDNNTVRPEMWAFINITLNENGSAAILEWTNSTVSVNFSMSSNASVSLKNWYANITSQNGTVNGTITYRVYANDTYGNMNVTANRTVTLNYTNYPQYSAASVGVNSTERNASALFTANWTDVAGLAGYIFSTNNNGTWVNYTWTPFTGVSNTSTFTISKLNDTRTTVVGYIFYANNTYGRWNYTNSTLTIGCTESWSVGTWSSCSGGTQTRTRNDDNNCGTLNSPPPVSQSCTDNTTTSGSSGTPTPSSSFAAFPNDIVTKVKVNLKLGLTSPSVAVSMLTTVPVSAPAEKVYQYLSITKSNFIDVNIDNATIEFSVTKSWMSTNSLTNISLARYDGTKWNKLKTDFVSSTSDTNKYVAYTTAFSYFAILGEAASSAPAAQQNAGNSTTNLSSSSSQANETSNNSAALETKPPEKKTSGLLSPWTIAGIALAVVLSAAAYIISKKGVGGLSGLLPKKAGGIPGKNNAPPPWSIPTERKPELPKKSTPSVPVDNDEERRKKNFYSYQGS